MNFLSTTEFRSKLFPDVRFTLRVVTVGRRIEFLKAQNELDGDLEWRSSRAVWNTLVADFDGIEIDGTKPSIDALFLNGPQELVNEVSEEFVRMGKPLHVTDSNDEEIIEDARRQIAEAETRMATRKNSEPQSSGPIPEAVTPIAANATATPGSESNETAKAIPA